MAKQTKITKSARGQDCTLLLGNCSSNETVVLCHIGKIRGMGYKCGDHFAVYGCGNCHKIIDGQVNSEFTEGELAEINLIITDLLLHKKENSMNSINNLT